MRTVPPVPLYADLIYTSDAAGTSEEAPASSAAGTVECSACKMEVVVRELRQHVGGQIQETKVRPVCLLRTSMFPRKPIRSVWMGETNFLTSKNLAMTSLLIRVMT